MDLRRLALGSEVQLFNKDINSMIGEIVRVGRYCARFALSKDDLLAAQELRYRCFNLSNDKGLDVDEFDSICRHVLVENLENGKLISGAKSFLIIWGEIPKYKFLKKTFEKPLIFPLFNIIYEVINFFKIFFYVMKFNY